MKVYYFSEFPYHEYDDEESLKYESLRVVFPNSHFNPDSAHSLFQRYIKEAVHCEEMGFDGVMVNEHHTTPSSMNVSVNITAGILAQQTKNLKILLMGNLIPMHENPVRVAEEVAMLDVISGGRIISGFVRGVWAETWAGNIRPTDNRERFQECHDLIVKAWTEPGPFRWEGKHYQFRVVNPWMVPVQKPHPPVWVPGSSSPETAEFAARRQYTYVAFLAPVDVTADLFDYYREVASEEGYEPSPDNFGYLICCYVGETEEEAQREAQHFVWRMGPTGRAPRHLLVPPGYLTESGVKMQQRRNKPLSLQSYQELQDNYHIVAGTPDQVIEKLWHLKDKLNMGHLIFYGQESRMSHEASMRNIDLFGKEVMPVVREW